MFYQIECSGNSMGFGLIVILNVSGGLLLCATLLLNASVLSYRGLTVRSYVTDRLMIRLMSISDLFITYITVHTYCSAIIKGIDHFSVQGISDQMHNVNVIFTSHRPCGNCNPVELYHIIESIKPEIIFEELSIANYDRSYRDDKLKTVETDAIKLYLQHHSIEHVPVDTFNRPESYESDYEKMMDKIIANRSIAEVREFCQLVDGLAGHVREYGFRLLNSRYNDEYMKRMHELKEAILNKLNSDQFFQIHLMDMQVVDNREDVMLSNIYHYSSEHQYDDALFFIGSGHRQSILQKTERFNNTMSVKLNWVFHEYSFGFS